MTTYPSEEAFDAHVVELMATAQTAARRIHADISVEEEKTIRRARRRLAKEAMEWWLICSNPAASVAHERLRRRIRGARGDPGTLRRAAAAIQRLENPQPPLESDYETARRGEGQAMMDIASRDDDRKWPTA